MNFTKYIRNQSFRRMALFLGGFGFFLGLVFSVRNHPELIDQVDCRFAFLVVIIGVPLSMLTNAFEFMLIGSSLQCRIPFFRALEVAIMATASNLLPLPGGAITRVAALRCYQIEYGKAVATIIVFAVTWLAIAFVLVGGSLFYQGIIWPAWIFIFAGLVTCASCLFFFLHRGVRFRLIGLIIIQRMMQVTIGTLRIWCCLMALGVGATFLQAAVFVVGGVVGSAVSVVPGGLGIREGVSAILAPLVGLAAAAGFMAAALDRILSFFLLIPASFGLGFVRRNEQLFELRVGDKRSDG